MILLTHVTEDDERRWPMQMARTRDSFVHGRRNMVVEERGTVEHTSTGTLCKFAHEVRVVPRGPPHRPRRRRLSGGIRERIRRQMNKPPDDFMDASPARSQQSFAFPKACNESRGANERRKNSRSCNTVVGRRYGLPTGAYRYTQALCRTEVEYGLYWRHLLHG
ncbi:LOW QUALITY PROTEIN: uncharacterized protein LOC117604682 [Osmia lignaria lignaria]|uniref:LOW QUALITY PROTEIN: uncharacterized protein LOC117604682 n=1 Tax=Osmia lignaria lignaria TaxID=1437193 RepID=UPI00402B98A4